MVPTVPTVPTVPAAITAFGISNKNYSTTTQPVLCPF